MPEHRRTRRLRRVKQTGGALTAQILPVWNTHMAPAFAAPRVFFIAGSEDMKYTEETIVSSETLAGIAAGWSALTQTFCPLEIEADKALLRFRGEEDEAGIYDFERVLALCVNPTGNIEGFALIHLNKDEDGIETDILCAGREDDAKRVMIEGILEDAIKEYDEEAFEDDEEDNKKNTDENDDEEEDSDEE